MHCDDAPCIPPCPIEGAIYKREDGLVIIDSDKCTGCKNCVDACPYDAIYFNDDLNLAQKCTGCAHLLDGGEWKIPRCADACPTEAIKFGEESEFADLIAKAEVLKPETGRQAAGLLPEHPEEVHRPARSTTRQPKRSSIGATCTLTGSGRRSLHGDHRRLRRLLVPRPGRRRHLQADHRGQGLRGQDLRRDQHREGRQPGRHSAGEVAACRVGRPGARDATRPVERPSPLPRKRQGARVMCGLASARDASPEAIVPTEARSPSRTCS